MLTLLLVVAYMCASALGSSFDWQSCDAAPVNTGSAYFRDMYDLFQTAQEVILSGWLFTPNVPLFGPPGSEPVHTLSDLVQSASGRGAQIYVIFWETAASSHVLEVRDASESLAALGENVHVLVDIGRFHSPTLLWCAHIKTAVFDRNVAFVGGLDIADSRLDFPDHRLQDPRRVPRDLLVEQPGIPLLPSTTGNGKPWQDVMVRVTGRAARDVATVAVERWRTFCESSGYRKRSFLHGGSWRSASPKSKVCRDGELGPPPDDLGKVTILLHSGCAEIRFASGCKHCPERSVAVTSRQPAVLDLGDRRDLARPLEVSVRHSPECNAEALAERPVPLTSTLSRPTRVRLAYEEAQRELSMDLHWQQTSASHTQVEETSPNQCRLNLNGGYNWLGVQEPVNDLYPMYLSMVRNAKSYVYIENQYFMSDLSTPVGRCDSLLGKARNQFAMELYTRITRAAVQNESFSVVVVLPFATEEPMSQYPNLRTLECMYGKLEEFWTANNLTSDYRDYFSVFVLGNAMNAVVEPEMVDITSRLDGVYMNEGGQEYKCCCSNTLQRCELVQTSKELASPLRGAFGGTRSCPALMGSDWHKVGSSKGKQSRCWVPRAQVPAGLRESLVLASLPERAAKLRPKFYGIFVHSKVLIVDDEVATVGSANINDRSFYADRDAEVGMEVRGPFAARLRAELMQAHAAATPSLDSLASDLRAVARRNAALLADAGLDVEKGLIRRGGMWRAFIDKERSPLLATDDAVRVASGDDWVELDAAEAPALQGRLLPWTPELWGNPRSLRGIENWFEPSWLQRGEAIV